VSQTEGGTSEAIDGGTAHKRGARKRIAPERRLRYAGIFGLISGVVIIASAVFGATLLSPATQSDAAATDSTAYQVLFLVALGILGIIEFVAGVFGVAAGAHFPRVVRFAGPNDFLPFLAGFVTFVCGIGLSVLNAGLYAGMVVVVFVIVVVTTFVTRRAMVEAEAQDS
jgi:Na+-driven multidrug efflux pump